MKLTVPQPEPEPTPVAAETSNAAPSADPAPKEPKAATWPDWFGITDLAMVVFVGLAAFLLGSFTARNSDAWLHLGIGRIVASGDYSFGKDPLSFTGADRLWVNHSWLYDLISYQLLKANPTGAVLVAAKASLFVLALAFLIAIRRAGRALWPWAGFAALAALAAAPHLQLRPIVASTPFLAATLYVLFRADWKPSSWRNPILLALLFGAWANIDACFVLGPLAVLLVLVGEVFQAKVLKGRGEGGAVPLGVPPVAGLAKALGLGVVACMLNPHHVNVWEFPAEFGYGFPAELANDTELQLITLSPFTPLYWEQPQRGYNLNGLSLVLLLLGSGAVLAAGFGRLRASHLLLWIAFAYLAVRQSQLTLFFAVTAVPLAAGYLNALSAGITLTTWANRGTRLLLTGSGIGRLVCLPLSVLMVVCAWPGWLQPPASQPAFTRRAEWRMEADVTFERPAKRLAAWTAAGTLPPDVRGLASSFQFGNYLAWFAPGEKAFVNARFNFHKPELPDLYDLRKALTPSKDAEERIDAVAVREIADRYKAGFLVLTPVGKTREITQFKLLLGDPGTWYEWSIDGRASILGRIGVLDEATERRLAFHSAREVFAPDQPVLPEGKAVPPTDRTWLDEFKGGVKPYPVAADDAFVYELKSKFARQQGEEFFRFKLFRAGSAVTGPAIQLLAPPVVRPLADLSDNERANAIAQLRAAREAVAANSDSPEGYYALIAAYLNPALPDLWPDGPQFPGERMVQRQTAAVQYLARIPPPEKCPPEQAKRAFDLAMGLLQDYMRTNPPQLDFAQEAMKKAKAYFPMGRRLELQYAVETARKLGGAETKQAEARLKAATEGVDGDEKKLTDVLGEQIGKFEQMGGQGSAVQKFQAAMQAGLPGRAIEVFKADVAAFGEYQTQVAFVVLEIELRSGRVEQAAQDFKELSDGFDDLGKKMPPQQAEELQSRLREFEYRKCVLEGNYARAGVLWEQLNGRFPKLRAEDRALAAALPRGNVPEQAVAGGQGVAALVLFAGLVQQATQVVGALQTESQFYHVRGLLFLIEGQIAEARKRLAVAPYPQGMKTLPIPWAGLDEQYVRMIDAAAK